MIKYEYNNSGKDIRYISAKSDDFPEKLKNYADCPKGLYVIGSLPPKEGKVTAVVGARKCSYYGEYMAEKLAGEFAAMDVGVISGMAVGVDSAAHGGAIKKGGKTYAVLGCGVDVCYPKCNSALYKSIAENGGIISEYPPGTPPAPYRFPQRNRIISGLSDVVIVVEAGARSGSLITADLGLEQGRDVYAVPGRYGDKLSEGCNELIKKGAGLITEARDVFPGFEDAGDDFNKNNIIPGLEKHFQVVYSCLGLYPKPLHAIIEETGFEPEYVMRILVRLLMMELICEPSGNVYAKKD